jgi:hypothetical protein
MSMDDLPLEDVLSLDDVMSRGTDPDQAYDGGWEEALDEGDGFEDHLLGEKPTTPEV